MTVDADRPVPTIDGNFQFGLAIASLVLGVVAICYSFLLIGSVFGGTGLAVGLVSLRRRQGGQAIARWGVGLSVLGLVASIAFGALYFIAYRHFRSAREARDTTSDEAQISEWEGSTAPDFTLTTLEGKKITLSELKGKRVVLDFWETWCGPCKKEIPHFERLVGETARENLVVIGISSADEKVLRDFVANEGINYRIASSAGRKLPQPYAGLDAVPTTFFIDRRGIIQHVSVGYHDFETLKQLALAKDVVGPPKARPATPVSGLRPSGHPLTANEAWSVSIPEASALCTGDWSGSGDPEILVADRHRRLHVLSLAGTETATVPLPEIYSLIECGHTKNHGARLLGYSSWGQGVSVLDRDGTKLWTYGSFGGVDGAHWGDVDGDGTDELIVGFNGTTGLHAVNADGERLWKVTDIGNVWSQAVIPAHGSHAALVFATEAGGSVKVYDPHGMLVRSVRPQGRYFAKMSATAVDGSGRAQVIAVANDKTIAFDQSGEIAWSTSAPTGKSAWRDISFAAGDIGGNGELAWAFLEATGDLVIASALGEELCAIPDQKSVNSFVFASTPGRGALLVTLRSGTVQAYRFEAQPSAAPAHS